MNTKRRFRQARAQVSQENPAYPTLESFDHDRRRFLTRLGQTILGAGAVALIGACDSRSLAQPQDGGATDGKIDPKPDGEIFNRPPGSAPFEPARADVGPEWGVDGDVTQPDAKIDMPMAGGAPMPPSRGDAGNPPQP